jgi:hypothetical protein
LAATVDLPTPPFPEPTATTLATFCNPAGAEGRTDGPRRAAATKDDGASMSGILLYMTNQVMYQLFLAKTFGFRPAGKIS